MLFARKNASLQPCTLNNILLAESDQSVKSEKVISLVDPCLQWRALKSQIMASESSSERQLHRVSSVR